MKYYLAAQYSRWCLRSYGININFCGKFDKQFCR